MTKRITSEDCEGNIEDIEDGRYNSHVVPVSAEDDPGYEEIDYGDCTEFTVPLGRYGSHVVPIGGGGGGGAACPNGGLKPGTDINGDACLSVNLKPGGAIILDNKGQLAIDTSKLKITTDQVYPAGTDTGIVIDGNNGESWDTQYDYNQWLYTDQERQDDELERVELESKARDLILELEILYLLQHNQECKVGGNYTYLPSGPPFSTGNMFSARDNVIQCTDKLLEDIEPEAGRILRINGNHYNTTQEWSSVITNVGEKQSLGSGWWVFDITLEDTAPTWLTGMPGGSIFQISSCIPAGFVKTEGDTMTGDLFVNADVHANRVDTREVDSGENSNLILKHNGTTKVYVGGSQVTIVNPLKLQTEGTDDDHAVTKKYIDDTKDFLQNEIIELEEEIEAIAPSSERGSWAFNPVGNVTSPGAYTMYTDSRDDGLGGVASIFAAVKNITLNERDLNNTVHNFGSTDPGDLLEIFEEGDADYGLYSIISIEKLSSPNPGGVPYTYISIDVNLERTGNGDMADSRARFKVFKAPSGGTADGFVLKSGDTMTGDLTIDRSVGNTDVEAGLILKGSRGNLTSPVVTISFENEQSSEKGEIEYRSHNASHWFGFNRDIDLNNKGLHTVGQIRLKNGGYIGSGTNQRIIIRDGSGSSNDAGTEIQRVGNGRRSFAIRGKPAGSNDVEDFFWVYGGGGGDAISYTGLTTDDNHIATKKYVDDSVVSSSASSELYTLTTCGNHYTYSTGSDAPGFTNFRTATQSMEYNTEYHFKQLWTHENYGALLKAYWEPTHQTMFELYIRAKLVLKTPIKNWKVSDRDHMCVMFSPAGPTPMTHEHTAFYHNSTYEVVLTHMRMI